MFLQSGKKIEPRQRIPSFNKLHIFCIVPDENILTRIEEFGFKIEAHVKWKIDILKDSVYPKMNG
jgi:hypothetical protein